MKHTILGLITMATLTFGFTANANAQDNDRASRRAEMQNRQRERLVKELKLTDEQTQKFNDVYGRYQAELSALIATAEGVDAQTGASAQQDKKDKKEKKELTDAEATAELQKYFDQQAEHLQRQQARLDIQKKYCAELSAFLTPQQLVKVFRQQRGRDGNGNGQQRQQRGNRGGRGGRGGFGGGPRGGGFGGGFGGGDRGGFGGEF